MSAVTPEATIIPIQSSPTLTPTSPSTFMDIPSPSVTPCQTPVTSKVYTPWSEVLSSRIIHPFVAPSLLGPTISIPHSPLGIFRQFCIIQEIVKQTNHYAENVMEPEKYSQWCGVTAEDIEAFSCFFLWD